MIEIRTRPKHDAASLSERLYSAPDNPGYGTEEHDQLRVLAIDIAGFVWGERMRAMEIFEAMTGDLQYAIRIVNERLPGWIYKVCRCHISDDAWLCPDYNDPEHKERFAREIGNYAARSIWDEGVDVALSPPHGRFPGRALLIATVEAVGLLHALKTDTAPERTKVSSEPPASIE